MTEREPLSEVHEIACSSCGATLEFSPGTSRLKCRYCGAENEIETASDSAIEEFDYHAFLRKQEADEGGMEETHTVACSSCGATTTLLPNVTADNCPFCATPFVVQADHTTRRLKPRYMLPFSVVHNDAVRFFETWIAKRWFAPGNLKRYATDRDRICGLYIPYWTYDSSTNSVYTGQRGTNHTQSYSTVVNGRRVTQTRVVIHWRRVHGSVSRFFDDVLIVASRSLPEKYAARLEPWDLEHLEAYNPSYCAGFRSEAYGVGLDEGFEKAKQTMEKTIREDVRRDIGGDHQRITSLQTAYHDITFKHILLPIWLSAYRYKGKVYRFMVNGRTGEVQGERPWSIVKITLAVAAGAAAVAAAWCLLHPYFR